MKTLALCILALFGALAACLVLPELLVAIIGFPFTVGGLVIGAVATVVASVFGLVVGVIGLVLGLVGALLGLLPVFMLLAILALPVVLIVALVKAGTMG